MTQYVGLDVSLKETKLHGRVARVTSASLNVQAALPINRHAIQRHG
jgi:hypothetical protein